MTINILLYARSLILPSDLTHGEADSSYMKGSVLPVKVYVYMSLYSKQTAKTMQILHKAAHRPIGLGVFSFGFFFKQLKQNCLLHG